MSGRTTDRNRRAPKVGPGSKGYIERQRTYQLANGFPLTPLPEDEAGPVAPTNGNPSTTNNGQRQAGATSSYVTHRPRKDAKIITSETKFLRARWATADITSSDEGFFFNHYQLVQQTHDNNYIKNNVYHPFQAADFNFAQYFSEFSRDQQVAFMTNNWIEIVMKPAHTPDVVPVIFDQIKNIGSEFTNNIQNLVVKIELPELPVILRQNTDQILASPGIQAMRDAVEEINQLPAISKMNVVLTLPSELAEGEKLHDLQLLYAIAFFPLSFTKWTLKFHAPGMFHPALVSFEDQKRINKMERALGQSNERKGDNGLDEWRLNYGIKY